MTHAHGFCELKHRKVVFINDWQLWYKRNFGKYTSYSRKIRSTHLTGLHISTVFLGLDCSFGGRALYFETKIFDREGEPLGWQSQCATHRVALKMHQNAIQFAKGYLYAKKHESVIGHTR